MGTPQAGSGPMNDGADPSLVSWSAFHFRQYLHDLAPIPNLLLGDPVVAQSFNPSLAIWKNVMFLFL
jgi:hypothetical protein